MSALADPIQSIGDVRVSAGGAEGFRIRVPIQSAYPLDRAGEAIQALPTTHTQGKLGITIT